MPTDQLPPPRTETADRPGTGWRSVGQSCNALICRALGYSVKLLVVCYFIFCALFLSLRYVVLPQIASYRVEVEQVAGKALGRPVSIEAITASWKGLRPYLALTNVVIHDKNGDAALTLPSVSATVSWWSVAVADLRLHKLEIDKPDLNVERDAAGNFYVAGLLVDLKKDGDGRAANWVLSQHEIRIRDGKLSWRDDKRQAPELALNGVDFVLRNDGRHHRFALTATPPDAIAAPLDVRASFYHPHFTNRISDATRWSGELYTDLRNTDLAAWKTYIDFPFDLQQARGSMRAWLTFDHARVADLTADLSLSDVSVQLRKDMEPVALAHANGRISIRESLDGVLHTQSPAASSSALPSGTPSGALEGSSPVLPAATPMFGMQGHTISVIDFSLQTADGLILPKTTMSERYVASKNGAPERIEVQATSLDLHAWADFAGRLPLPATQLRMLQDFAPRGYLKNFSAQLQGTYPEIESYKVKGDFIGLSMNAQAARPARAATAASPAQAAVPAIPGFENLTGHIDANSQGGSFLLASDKLKLSLPGHFAEVDMPIDALKMDARWTFQKNDQLLLDVRNMSFAKDGLTASFAGTHLMPLTKKPGQALGAIDMTGTLSGLALNKVGDYLPLGMEEHVRHWLANAMIAGTLRDGHLRIKGDLAQFPFRTKPGEKPKGEFVFSGKIDDGGLNYAPGMFGRDGKTPMWPLLEKIKGSIRFDRTRMEIKGESGRTHGADVFNVKAVVPDLLSPEAVLEIDGNAAGTLQDLVRYTVDSPVAGWIGNFTDETRATGNGTLALKLQLPLHHMLDAKVQGVVKFANSDVSLQNIIPALTQASGQLEFNEKGLTLKGIKANALGGPLTVAGGSQPDGSILIKVDGSITAAGLKKAYPSAGMQKLADRISGGTRYGVTVGVRNKRVELAIESSLRGLELNFPAPLRKAARDAMPLRIEQASASSTDSAMLLDAIKLSLGSSISASYLREKSASDMASNWRVVRGGIGVNAPAPEPDSGVSANLSLRSLSVDDWMKVTSSINQAGAATGAQKKMDTADTFNMAQYVEPNVLAARTNELFVMGKKFDDVVMGVSRDKDTWQANIDSTQAAGHLTWIESASGRGLGKVTARLTSLVVPKSVNSEANEMLDGVDNATEMPALDISADRFELLGKKMGRLELLANYVRATEGREWRIRNLSLANADATLTAKGSWLSQGGNNVSSLDYRLAIVNAGNLLNRFGFADVLRGGKGKMDGEISWKGLPFSFDIPSLTGKISLDIAAGQFLKVEPGAAKLLGVLSLQSIPRRLSLDFRDVFAEGFAFDGITGNATIANGVASTDSLKMRGVSATVLIDGTADVAKESQNLRAVVIPEINAGAASVAYALAINPVIGVGTFLAQLFLREPLARAFTYEYTITGPWSDPHVTKIDRKAGLPAPLPPATRRAEILNEG